MKNASIYGLMILGCLVPSLATADTKSQYYNVDVARTYNTTNSTDTVVASCTHAADIIVGGGCYNSDSMTTVSSYPLLGTSTVPGSYTCSVSATNGTVFVARALCKTPGTDSKSNYYQTSYQASAVKSLPSSLGTGVYGATAYCSGNDPVVSGGAYSQNGWFPTIGGIESIVSQYPQPNGNGNVDFWHASVRFNNNTGNAQDTLTTFAICKTSGNKSAYEIGPNSTTWSSYPGSPKRLSANCSSASSIILSGGCWGTGIYNGNASYPQGSGVGNTDFFQCNIFPNSSGQLGVYAFCLK